MSTLLTDASVALFRRPPEDHFGSFGELRTAAAEQRARCTEVEAREKTILFSESGSVHFGEHTLDLTHYAMGQLAAMARVPMALLERLRPETRASVLNQTFPRGRKFKVGLADGDHLRAVTSDRYERVWDEELYEVLDRWLVPSGFIPAIPTLNRRSEDKPALFRSDRDSFAFFYSEEDPNDAFGGLRKGVVVYNSEVGAKCLGFSTFLFRDVCSNFLIWGAEGVEERSARHTSGVRDLFRTFEQELRAISNKVSPLEYSVIEQAARTPFTTEGSPEATARRLNKEFGIPRTYIPEVLQAIEGPSTVWGVVNGITSVAKTVPYAEESTGLATLAGNLLRTVG